MFYVACSLYCYILYILKISERALIVYIIDKWSCYKIFQSVVLNSNEWSLHWKFNQLINMQSISTLHLEVRQLSSQFKVKTVMCYKCRQFPALLGDRYQLKNMTTLSNFLLFCRKIQITKALWMVNIVVWALHPKSTSLSKEVTVC